MEEMPLEGLGYFLVFYLCPLPGPDPSFVPLCLSGELIR